jgi:hypothetical protein
MPEFGELVGKKATKRLKRDFRNSRLTKESAARAESLS